MLNTALWLLGTVIAAEIAALGLWAALKAAGVL